VGYYCIKLKAFFDKAALDVSQVFFAWQDRHYRVLQIVKRPYVLLSALSK
jgi:hypothetical protein